LNIFQHDFTIKTSGREMINITPNVADIVALSKFSKGICQVFIHHTSASLLVCENAEKSVQHDLEVFMGQLVSDGDEIFSHITEGPDDMPSHIRSVLTQTTLSVPLSKGALDLGQWQGLYLWEHRLKAHTRRMTVTLLGI
jgi:secondary thiamine-phosphate synthase enzyme